MNIKKTSSAMLLVGALALFSPVYAEGVVGTLTDGVNSGVINTKMVASDSLPGIEVDATVVNGIAIFSGQVRSKEQINELIRIAHSVSGIKGVDVSKLKIVKN